MTRNVVKHARGTAVRPHSGVIESVKGAEVLFRRVEEFDIVLKKTADDKYLSQVREQQTRPEDLAIARASGRRVAEITARVRG
jgi:hypothetical protein